MAGLVAWVRSFFPQRTLRGVTRPTRVRVRGELIGEELQRSAMTGRRGTLIEWAFWDRRLIGKTSDRAPDVMDDKLVARGRAGAELLVRVQETTVLVALSPAVAVEFLGEWDPGPVPGLLPDEVAAAHPALARVTEDLRYDEKVLHIGQQVELFGWLEPVQKSDDPYRTAPATHDFVASPALGILRVIERSS